MRDTNEFPEGPDDDCIMIASAGGGFWLLDGEHHLSAMLSGSEPYPTPVKCVEFKEGAALEAFLRKHGARLASLWSIHPAIVDRLKKNDELVAVSPPDAE